MKNKPKRVRKRLNKRVRNRLGKHFIEWDDHVKYAATTITNWGKRAAKFGYAREDLLNEAFIVFLKAKKTYQPEEKHKASFNTYFATCLFNHFNNLFTCLYNKDKKNPVGSASLIEEDLLNGGFSLWEPIAHRIHEAPDVVVEALDYMLNARTKTLDNLGFRKPGSRNNALFCRILGYNPAQINIMDEVKKFIIQSD
jgi:hypothetical protein